MSEFIKQVEQITLSQSGNACPRRVCTILLPTDVDASMTKTAALCEAVKNDFPGREPDEFVFLYEDPEQKEVMIRQQFLGYGAQFLGVSITLAEDEATPPDYQPCCPSPAHE